jgi:hypothetical protein
MTTLVYIMLVIALLSSNVDAGEPKILWPMGAPGQESANVTSSYGPRAHSSWFHKGIDLAITGYGDFVAPFKAKVVNFNYSRGCDNYLDLIPAIASSTPGVEGVRFYHINPPTHFDIEKCKTNGCVIDAGAVIGTVTITPCTGPHLHFEVWDDKNNLWNRNQTRHPFQWLTYPTGSEHITPDVVVNTSNPTNIALEITLFQKENALSLNSVEVSAYDSTSGETTIRSVNFNSGTGVNKDFTGISPKYIYTHTDQKNKLEIQPYSFNGVTDRMMAFRFFYSPKPNTVTVTVKNMNGIVIGQEVGIQLKPCIGCNKPGRPLPPADLTAVTKAGGVQLSWSSSLSVSASTDTDYIIYRRPSNSPSIYYIEPIGYIREKSSTTGYYTFFDALTRQTAPVPEPGAFYKYSIAALNYQGEGPNGPCLNPDAYNKNGVTLCSEFREVEAQMPQFHNVNAFFVLDKTQTFPFNPDDPRAVGAIEGTFTIRATFRNRSNTAAIYHPFFRVVKLESAPSVSVKTKHALINADGGLAFPGEGATVTPIVSDGILPRGQSLTVDFVIGLLEREPFNFFVDILGVPIP